MIASTIKAFSDEMQKIAWNSSGFKEGFMDEALPLGGAVAGVALGHKNPLRSAALGYAAGGLASIARSKARGEKPSAARKALAYSALGYGMGGLAHGQIQKATAKLPNSSKVKRLFHGSHTGPGARARAVTEEALPAVGASLGAGIAGASSHKDE